MGDEDLGRRIIDVGWAPSVEPPALQPLSFPQTPRMASTKGSPPHDRPSERLTMGTYGVLRKYLRPDYQTHCLTGRRQTVRLALWHNKVSCPILLL